MLLLGVSYQVYLKLGFKLQLGIIPILIHNHCCLSLGFIGKITLQIPFYRPHSDPWVISMSKLNLIIGPAQLQEYDEEKEHEEERERKKRLLKTLEDKWKVGGSTLVVLD